MVDRGKEETQGYVTFAIAHDYWVELREPESDWWQEIRVLLKYKHLTGPALDAWAEKSSQLSGKTHRVPKETIRHWMESWK